MLKTLYSGGRKQDYASDRTLAPSAAAELAAPRLGLAAAHSNVRTSAAY